MTMMSANVDEREEQTMARFLNGLNIPVKRIVEFLPYTNMVELLHQATRAERQVREDLASAKTKTIFTARNATNTSSSIKTHKCYCLQGSSQANEECLQDNKLQAGSIHYVLQSFHGI